MTTPCKAAVVQMCATADVYKNLRVTGKLVTQAAEAGASALFAPEAFTFIGPGRERAKMLEALPDGGPGNP